MLVQVCIYILDTHHTGIQLSLVEVNVLPSRSVVLGDGVVSCEERKFPKPIELADSGERIETHTKTHPIRFNSRHAVLPY